MTDIYIYCNAVSQTRSSSLRRVEISSSLFKSKFKIRFWRGTREVSRVIGRIYGCAITSRCTKNISTTSEAAVKRRGDRSFRFKCSLACARAPRFLVILTDKSINPRERGTATSCENTAGDRESAGTGVCWKMRRFRGPVEHASCTISHGSGATTHHRRIREENRWSTWRSPAPTTTTRRGKRERERR